MLEHRSAQALHKVVDAIYADVSDDGHFPYEVRFPLVTDTDGVGKPCPNVDLVHRYRPMVTSQSRAARLHLLRLNGGKRLLVRLKYFTLGVHWTCSPMKYMGVGFMIPTASA